jgi:hypothetical protein
MRGSLDINLLLIAGNSPFDKLFGLREYNKRKGLVLSL